MICDICNAEVNNSEESILKNEDSKSQFIAGFGIDEVNVEMLTSSGMTRGSEIEMLQASSLRSQSDWLLCPKCAANANQFREQGKAL